MCAGLDAGPASVYNALDEVFIMFQSEIAGIVFFLVAVFFAPALLMAGFQTMAGQKVRFPSLVKPLCKAFAVFASLVLELAGVVASAVAELLPKKYERLQPFVRPVVKVGIICTIVWFLLAFVRSMAGK